MKKLLLKIIKYITCQAEVHFFVEVKSHDKEMLPRRICLECGAVEVQQPDKRWVRIDPYQ